MDDLLEITNQIFTEKIYETTGDFKYNAHWDHYSRVLSRDDLSPKYVEVDLTPSAQRSWENIIPINIRVHRTKIMPLDEHMNKLPDITIEQMIEQVGPELTYRLMTEDFLSQINWKLHKVGWNGGSSFYDIRKTG